MTQGVEIVSTGFQRRIMQAQVHEDPGKNPSER